MTLFKAINAAREKQATLDALGRLSIAYHSQLNNASGPEAVMYELDNFLKHTDTAHKALAALPDKPMTEDEMEQLIFEAHHPYRNHSDCYKHIVQALKAANVLYVEEK